MKKVKKPKVVVNPPQKTMGTQEALNQKPEKTHSNGNAINVRNTTRPDCWNEKTKADAMPPEPLAERKVLVQRKPEAQEQESLRLGIKMKMETKVIIGIGDGAEKSHNTRLWPSVKEIEPQNKYLLRECLSCGREKLRYRQRLCDDCRLKHRKRTKRENYYKSQKV